MDFLDPNPSPRLSGRYDRGYLPHVRAQGRPYFVTFRLEGSLPQAVLRQFQSERDALLDEILKSWKGLRACLKIPERGCVVLDQPQQA